MDRRAFLGTLAGSLLAAPLAAEAQQAAKVARVGFLGANPAASPRLEAFLQGLRDLGYVEGRNVVIEYRNHEGKVERLPALAANPVPAHHFFQIVARQRISPELSLLATARTSALECTE